MQVLNKQLATCVCCTWSLQAAQYGDSQLVVTSNAVTIVVDPKAREGNIVPSVHAQVISGRLWHKHVLHLPPQPTCDRRLRRLGLASCLCAVHLTFTVVLNVRFSICDAPLKSVAILARLKAGCRVAYARQFLSYLQHYTMLRT
jgi:hypothetical protein